MAVMTIVISEEYTNPAGEGKIGVIKDVDTNCLGSWSVAAKTTTSVWIEWVIVGPGCLVSKDGGTAVNGETLTSLTDYTMTINTFRSPNNSLNTTLSRITVYLRAGDGGAILSQASLTRYNSGVTC